MVIEFLQTPKYIESMLFRICTLKLRIKMWNWNWIKNF